LAAKLELDALSKVLEFQVNYKTFPTKGPSSDVVTLVTLKTNPPKFCHGSGKTVEESQNDAASHALLLMSGDAGGSDGTTGSDGAAADLDDVDDVVAANEAATATTAAAEL